MYYTYTGESSYEQGGLSPRVKPLNRSNIYARIIYARVYKDMFEVRLRYWSNGETKIISHVQTIQEIYIRNNSFL